jgi:hypothetical protein
LRTPDAAGRTLLGESSRDERMAALEELTQFAGHYPDGHLDEARDGWPE